MSDDDEPSSWWAYLYVALLVAGFIAVIVRWR
jgi:hypothetical protein